MELEIIKETENPLFKRKEIQLSLEAEITPSKKEITDLIAQKFSTQVDNVSLKGIPRSGQEQVGADVLHYFRSGQAYNTPYAITDIADYYTGAVLYLDSRTAPLLTAVAFDIGDELELRNRFYLNSMVDSRLEFVARSGQADWHDYLVGNRRQFPLDGDAGASVTDWYENLLWVAQYYDKRHYLTTYSWDRTICPVQHTSAVPPFSVSTPYVGAQADVNRSDQNELAAALIQALTNSEADGV